ncbi:helix-turn-helix transcriptional regulator [Endozoicomonas arenosclerae]|uniref:helix-turn-helix transcriptional regulator n=1 Tax=Endozoicomonas arenosclerae TaxID=1633495 RepID=UPI0007866C2B|nr:YafY family protein [Endozoicomonas arenosclerae]
MRKSDRLFQLTNILRAHQPITAKQLAEKLSVSERTIYRYIDDLSVSGIPVYGEAGLGYRLSEGFELPPLQLTQAELEALVVGVNMVAAWTGPTFSEASSSLLNKIEAALPEEFSSSGEFQRSIRTPGEHRRVMDFEVWETLHSAIQSGHWLLMSYQSLSDENSSRTIFPLGLFYWGNKWTLGSWCHQKSAYRDFRLDRISKLEVVTTDMKLPDSVCLKAYIQYQKARSQQNDTDTMLSGD